MKKSTQGTLKWKILKSRLRLPEWQVIGLMEAIWKFTEWNCPEGDIGRFSNQEIAGGIEYFEDIDALIDLLVELHWIDEDKRFRLIIHDWSDHCSNSVKGNLRRHGGRYGNQFCDEIAKRQVEAGPENSEPVEILPGASRDIPREPPSDTPRDGPSDTPLEAPPYLTSPNHNHTSLSVESNLNPERDPSPTSADRVGGWTLGIRKQRFADFWNRCPHREGGREATDREYGYAVERLLKDSDPRLPDA